MAHNSLKAVTTADKVDTGIAQAKRKAVAQDLGKALADTFTLYLKTLGTHWNVVGASFYSLHKLTEQQYTEMDAAIDVIAERIRALGELAPASFGDFAKISEVESTSIATTAEAMITELVSDHEAVARRMREFVATADEADDVVTADLLTARIGQHEAHAWMLRSMLA